MIFISGYTASGKSTALNFFNKRNFLCLDLGNFWRNYFEVSKSEEIVELINYNRLQSKNLFWDKEIVTSFIFENFSSQIDVVICGVRSAGDVSMLKRIIGLKLKTTRLNNIILMLNIEKTIQLSRYLGRKNPEDESLEQDILNDNKYGILELEKIADYKIANNGTVEDLEKSLELILLSKFKKAS